MRDIIWTIIIIWLIVKITSLFKKSKTSHTNHESLDQSSRYQSTVKPGKDNADAAMKQHLNNEGEYVDFEEIK